MDTLKAKHLKGEAASGGARVARLVSVWATGAGIYPGVGGAADTLGQGRAPTEKALELEPMVVTATVAPTPPGRTTAPVTVISREQIAAQQATSVTELSRQSPGVHIDQAGARGGISSVYVRGSDPNFTAVLIDGIKVNDPTNSHGGSFDFSTLSTDNIERIEVVRGPLSAVYGSDALGGVINIITRRGTEGPNGSVEVSAGRFGAYRTLLQANGTLSVMDYAVSGSYLDNGRPVEGSRFLGVTLQWSPRLDLDAHLHTIVVGTVPDSSIPKFLPGARTLDAYARVDFAVHWTRTRHWQVRRCRQSI